MLCAIPLRVQMSGLMMMEADDKLQQQQADEDAAAAADLEVGGRPQRKGKAKAGGKAGARTEGGKEPCVYVYSWFDT
jgi:hypothetical protein